MTREEAIDVLKHPNEEYHGSDATTGYTFYPNIKNFEAFQLAIKALEQSETVTEFTDRCKECGAKYGKLLKEKSWIPLSERLPEIQQNVLLTLKDRPFDDIVVGFRMTREPYRDFFIYCAGPGCIDPELILAWMPLPEPYKEENHEN